MKKIMFIPLLFVALCLSASPTGERKAREAAEAFFSTAGTKSVANDLELEYAASASGSERLYVYNRTEGGFAVIAADDRFSPVIAYSYENTFDSENIPEAVIHILDCWAEQISAGNVPQQVSSGNVILKYDTPSWGQSAPYNLEAPVVGGQRCVSGCVATAMSIVAYHNRWPSKGTGTTPSYSYESSYGYQTVPENALGRTYDYANMLKNYSSGYTQMQGAAVAALMKDMGTSVQMAYGPEGSGAISEYVPNAMATYFFYSKDSYSVNADGFDDRGWVEAIQNNLTQYGPTIVSGIGQSGGHAFIADGYTDNGYISFNFGWDGYSNGFYLLPSIEYNREQSAIFALEPDRKGTSSYEDMLTLCEYNDGQRMYQGLTFNTSEIKPGASYQCTVGGIANRGQVNFAGKCKLSICDKEGNVKADLTSEISISNLPPMYLIRLNSLSVKIPSSISEGDRIRFLYKGQFSDEWKWARKEDKYAYDEIILCPSPDELAESMNMKYSKTDMTLVFSSDYTIDWTLIDSKSALIASGKTSAKEFASIDVSALPSGRYLLSVSSGGSPYELILTF